MLKDTTRYIIPEFDNKTERIHKKHQIWTVGTCPPQMESVRTIEHNVTSVGTIEHTVTSLQSSDCQTTNRWSAVRESEG